MTGPRLRAVLAASLMLLGAALSYLGRPTLFLADQIGKPDLEVLFPKQFGEWRLQTNLPVVLPAPDVQARLDLIYNQVLTRTYVNAAGASVMLSVAYGGDQSDATRAHRPEICYPSQGFDITFDQIGQRQVAGGQLAVRLLMSNLGERQEPITYWMVVGQEVALSGLDQKMAQVRYGLRGLIADGMLVRVSSIDADMKKAHELHAGFISDLAAVMPPAVRPRVFGDLEL